MDPGRKWAGDLYETGSVPDPAGAYAQFAGGDGTEAWLERNDDGTLIGWLRDGTDVFRYTDADTWALDVDGVSMARTDAAAPAAGPVDPGMDGVAAPDAVADSTDPAVNPEVPTDPAQDPAIHPDEDPTAGEDDPALDPTVDQHVDKATDPVVNVPDADPAAVSPVEEEDEFDNPFADLLADPPDEPAETEIAQRDKPKGDAPLATEDEEVERAVRKRAGRKIRVKKP